MAVSTERRKELKFIQITGAKNELYGLTQGGQIYKYYPAANVRNKVRFAFWGKITGHKAKDD